MVLSHAFLIYFYPICLNFSVCFVLLHFFLEKKHGVGDDPRHRVFYSSSLSPLIFHLFGKTDKITHADNRAAIAAEHLMLVGFEHLKVCAGYVVSPPYKFYHIVAYRLPNGNILLDKFKFAPII